MRKLTLEGCKEKLGDRPIEILKYAGSCRSKHSNFKCKVCAREWTTSVNNVINGPSGCPHCSAKEGGKKVSVTYEEALKRIVGRNLEIIHYSGDTKSKSDFKCLICGNIWSTSFHVVDIRGSGCPECGKISANESKRIPEEICKERLKGLPLEMIYYDGKVMSNKSIFKCKICEYEWNTAYNSIHSSGNGCPSCGKKVRITEEECVKRLIGRPITLVQYGGTVSAKSTFNCTTCQHKWITDFGNIHSGNGCPKCSGRLSKSLEEVELILSSRPIRIREYSGCNKDKSTFICTVCEYIWQASLGNVLSRGSGCPICSKGGFKPNKPAWVYRLLIHHTKGICYGFGITNNLEDRLRAHRKELGEFLVAEYESLYFITGSDAEDVERIWRKSPYILNINIKGFKKECVLVNDETTKMLFS